MFPDIYPHASASITPYNGFFIENFTLFLVIKNEYQNQIFIYADIMHTPAAPDWMQLSIFFFMNPANCVYRNFHRAAHLMQKIKSSRCQSFFTIGHKHMPCRQIGCPALFCQARILHRMYGDTRALKISAFFVLPASP